MAGAAMFTGGNSSLDLGGGDLAPTRLADKVIERLAAAILDGELAPGDPMPSEARIADSFGVSKPIAREAMRQLASIGLVHVQQGKMSRVRSLNAESLERFYGFAIRGSEKRLREANELRRVTETGVARVAAQRRNGEGMKRLRAALNRMEQSLGKTGAFTEADIDFHQAIAAVTGNTMIQLQTAGMRAVHRAVSELLTRRRKRAAAEWQATYDRHAAIARAIETGDADAAEAAMHAHFTAAEIAAEEVAAALATKRSGKSK